jgi:hypothetical protein
MLKLLVGNLKVSEFIFMALSAYENEDKLFISFISNIVTVKFVFL